MRRHLGLGAAGVLLLFVVWCVHDGPLVKQDSGSTKRQELQRPSSREPGSKPAPPLHQDESPASTRDFAGSEQNRANRAELDRLIASVNWTEYGGALLAYLGAEENRRRDKTSEADPASIEILARGNAVLEQLAQLLGIQDSREILFHEKIAPSYLRGRIKALKIDLSAAQERELDDLMSVFSRSRGDWLSTMREANRLQRLAWESEQSLLQDVGIQKILTPGQFGQFTTPSGTDAFWGMQADRREVRSGNFDGMAKGVAGYWTSSLGLDENSRNIVAAAATSYVSDYQGRVLELQGRFPAGAPREEQIRLQIDLLRLQIQCERELGRKLGVTSSQLGSGKILQLVQE